MCDFSGKLVAWMDRELPDEEAAEVERHVRDCSECRGCVDAYEQVSREFAAYCDAAGTSTKTRRLLPNWVPVLSGAAAAVVLLVVFVLQTAVFGPAPVKPVSVAARVADASQAAIRETAARPVEKVHRRHLIGPTKIPRTTWISAEPAIQISIPAEAMFPPGAVPEGTTFIADVRMGADGSVQGLQLRQ